MFAKIAAVFDLLPRVVAVVKLTETLLDPQTPGAEKKQAALDALRDVGLPDSLVGLAGQLIDLVVSVMNVFGIFGHSKTKNAPEPTVSENRLSPVAKRTRDERMEFHANEEEFEKFLDDTK